MSLRHPVLESLTGREFGEGHFGDLDGGAGLGVASGPGRPVLRLEGAEAHQLHLVAPGNGVLDGVRQCIQGSG